MRTLSPMTTPAADRPQYADGTPVPPILDSSTTEFSRGLNQKTGAKGAEPAEPAPTITSITPTTGPIAGGTVVEATGDNMGGSTGVTVGGTAATGFSVLSETKCRFTTPGMGTAGAKRVVVLNPAGNSTSAVDFTAA